MGDTDTRAARDRIETVEKRIAAMHDAGVDVAALRAQLAFAHHSLREGRLADIEAICDEVLGAARRLAELGSRASQVRTPAHGTPVHQPTQVRTPAFGTPVPQSSPSASLEPSTEALQRVKVGRAQLADEVRAVIEAEVKSQLHPPVDPAIAMAPLLARLEELEGQKSSPPPAPAQPDLTPLLERLEAMEGKVSAPPPAPVQPDLSPLLERLNAMEGRLADAAAPPTVPAPAPDLTPILNRLEALESRIGEQQVSHSGNAEMLDHLRAVESRLGELAARNQADPALTAGVQVLADRLTTLESRPAATAVDETAIGAIVRKTIDDVVPRQASELLREAISKLPTRDDLHQIAETLRADLDWRLEKAAAEHGWCSLSDVQTTVRKSMAEQEPGSSGGSHLGRLEIAMAEFVQQSKEQQDRLIAALAERVVNHTKSLTKRMLVRDSAASERRHHETEELSPSFSSGDDGSSRMAAITSVAKDPPAKSPTEMSLDPVPPEILDASRRMHGDTTLFTKRIEVLPPESAGDDLPTEKQPDLHDLVTAEVERALRSGAASTMTEGPMIIGEGSSSSALATSGTDSRIGVVTSQDPAPATATAIATSATPAAVVPADLPVLIAAEVGRQLAMTVPVHLPPSDSDLARAIARALPQALQDDGVRTELFAVLALEAAGKPGVLGEMTGLRRFLKRELQQAAEHLAQPSAT
jgi:hypothetical protein